MQIIEITVRDRVATHIGDDYYVCGNSDYVIHFDFDEEWDALDVKTARFIAEGNILYPDRIFSGNVCSFPDNPPISNTTNVRVGVFAGNLQTTTPARIPAAKSILCGTGTPAAPEEDAYHEAMEAMAKVATDARTQAAASAQSAEASAQSAAEAAASAQSAAQAAETAGQYSGNADAQAEAAKGYAEAAANSAANAATSAENAENAKADAITNADDAEAAAKSAQEWAGRAETHAGSAATSAENAAASADAAAASAQSAAQTAEEIPDVYIVTVTQTDGVYNADRTYAEIGEAVKSKVCLLLHEGKTYRCSGLEWDGYAFYAFRKSSPMDTHAAIIYNRFAIDNDNSVTYTPFAEARTPNPSGLFFHGAVEAHYDGSSMVSIKIPEGGSGGSVETAEDAEALQALADIDMMVAVGGDDYVLTDENNNILEW